MEKLLLDNFIGGKSLLLSGKRYGVQSPFFEDYSVQAADSGLFDVNTAIFKAKNAGKECKALSFGEREQILKQASKKLGFDSSILEYTVKMTGMPVHYVRKHLEQIPGMLPGVPELIRNRLGLTGPALHHHVASGADLYSVFHPLDGFVYGVTPGNDPRAVPFVVSWCVALGIPLVIKPSKTDLLGHQKLAEALINEGYPADGLNVIGWNSDSQNSLAKNFALVDSASAIWIFGDDNTIDKVLRFSADEQGKQVDHFAGKVVLRHSSGRGAGIHDAGGDLKKTARIIVESAFEWPIACNALKALFTANSDHGELVARIKDITENEFSKHVGDPMKVNTRVGCVNQKLLKHVTDRVASLKKMRLLQELVPLKALSGHQTSPLLLETTDAHSEFLSKEYSIYVLAIKKCKSFEHAVEEANGQSGDAKRISITVLSQDEKKVLGTYLHAYHVKRLRHSTELDLLYHEGNDYLHKLMVPQIHRVEQKRSKGGKAIF